MSDYIEREAALKMLRYPGHGDYTDAILSAARGRICSIPAADVRKASRGKWILHKDGSGTCSECGRTKGNCWDLDNLDNFCHFCGAEMRLAEELPSESNGCGDDFCPI